MISINEKTILAAYKKAFIHMYEKTPVAFDSELWKEESGMVVLEDIDKSDVNITLKNDRFEYLFPYQEYFPYLNPTVIQEELDYWPTEFISPPRLKGLIEYLDKNKNSKRAIITLWSDKYRELSLQCPCTTTIFFRIMGDSLDMHTHMRANNASFLLYMDMDFLTGVHAIVANHFNLKRGTYIHFLDSLHIYRRDMDIVEKQYRFMKDSEIWQNV